MPDQLSFECGGKEFNGAMRSNGELPGPDNDRFLRDGDLCSSFRIILPDRDDDSELLFDDRAELFVYRDCGRYAETGHRLPAERDGVGKLPGLWLRHCKFLSPHGLG